VVLVRVVRACKCPQVLAAITPAAGLQPGACPGQSPVRNRVGERSSQAASPLWGRASLFGLGSL